MQFLFKSTSGDSYSKQAKSCGIETYEEDIGGELYCIIKVDTMAKLIALTEAIRSELIISNPKRFHYDNGEAEDFCVIEVYDEYRE